MTKYFCDVCNAELIYYDDQIRISAYGNFNDLVICRRCFADKAKWNQIIAFTRKKNKKYNLSETQKYFDNKKSKDIKR